MSILGYLMTGAVAFISTYAVTNDAKSATVGAGAAMAGKFVDGITFKKIVKSIGKTMVQAHVAKKLTPDTDRVSKRKQAEQQRESNEELTPTPA